MEVNDLLIDMQKKICAARYILSFTEFLAVLVD